MEAFEQKFNTFIDTLKKNPDLKLTWTDKMVTAFKAGLVNATFDVMTGGGSTQSVVIRKKRVNGYNLFMKERMAQLKEVDHDSNHRMKQISEEWNKLVETDKDNWKQKAVELVPVESTKTQVKTKKPKKSNQISGYQLFVREKMVEIKDKFAPKERMGEIGKSWKLMTAEEKEAINTRAKAIAPK